MIKNSFETSRGAEKSFRRTRWLAWAAINVSAVSAYAAAADAPSGDSTLEEITVTAQKRSERLLDVPISITALTPAALDRYDITDIKGLTKIAPNVQIEAISILPFGGSIFIRGAGERAAEPLNDQPNAMSVDGVYLVGFSGALFDTFDAQQVEVLRGPQGTLQGRNAVGGAVNITSRRPTFEDHVEMEVGAGNFKYGEGKFMVEGGLIPDLIAAKFAFVTENREGFIRNVSVPDSPFGSEESYFGRAGLLITPNSRTDIYLTFDYSLSRPGQVGHSADDDKTYVTQNHAPADAQTESANCAVYHYCTPDANWTTSATFVHKSLQKTGGLASNINIDLGGVKVTSVTGARRTAFHEYSDLDASVSPEFDIVNAHQVDNQVSQELRVASQPNGGLDFGGKMDWVTGLYVLHHHFDLNQPVFLNVVTEGIPAAACPVIPGARSDLPTPGCFLDLSGYRKQWLNSEAAFAHMTWRFTDQFNAFGGIRYTRDRKNFNQEANVGGEIVTPAGQAYELVDTNISVDAGIQYKITPDNVAYFHFSQGYRSGGFNSDSLPNVPDEYKPEKMNNFEIGLKSELFDRRLSINSTIFREDYKDMQRDVVHFLATSAPVQSVQNAAKAKIQGVEIEALAVPIPDLRLQLSFGYLDAKYLSYINGGVDESSLRLPFTPKTTVSASTDYTFHLPLAIFTLLTAGVDAQYKSAYTTAPTDDPVNAQAAFAKLNARLELTDESHKYSIALWGNNLTDKHTILNGEIDGNLNHFQIEDLPRMYGVRFGAKF